MRSVKLLIANTPKDNEEIVVYFHFVATPPPPIILMGFSNKDSNNNFSPEFSNYSIYLNLNYNDIKFKQLIISGMT